VCTLLQFTVDKTFIETAPDAESRLQLRESRFFTSSENVNTPMPWGRFCKTIRHNQVQARELKVKKAGTSLSTSPQYLPSSKKASARGL
jgi:hypothetical protein